MLKKLSITLITLTSFIFFNACSSKHIGIKENRPLHLSQESSSALYDYCDANVSAYLPQTGFYPLEDHRDSLAARLMLAKAAKHRITVQYFTFYGDAVGTILTKALIDAADRGVKVDILLDDIELSYDDDAIAMINTHKNVTIRVFNPTHSRRSLHYLEMGIYSDTAGRRMHNKSFTVDNSMAVYGGRNIGDTYFGLDEDNFFIDNDMLAVGPLVNKISNEFDIYFNNKYSVDFEYIAKSDTDDLKEILEEFNEQLDKKGYELLKKALENRDIYKKYQAKRLPLIFGDAELFYDMPRKIATDINDTSTHIQSKIPQKVRASKRFMMVSPYFIPNEKMINRIQRMRDKGVEVSVLTNSLESSDQTAVYAFYSLSQKRLLEMGVHLYEIHPHAFEKDVLAQSYNYLKVMPKAALHAKTIVIDDDIFTIGSVNMDPRSRNLNTELVSIISSKELNAYEAKVFKMMVAPENAYELSLEYDEDNNSEIVWSATIEGETKKFYNDGDASMWYRFKKTMSLWFPVEDLL